MLKQQSICQRCNQVCGIRDQSSLPHCRFLDVTQRFRKALHDIQKTAAGETRIKGLGSGIRDQGLEARVQESKLWDPGSGANFWDQYHFRPKSENYVLS